MEFTKENVLELIDSLKISLEKSDNKEVDLELYSIILKKRIETMVDLKDFLVPVQNLVYLFKNDTDQFSELSKPLLNIIKNDK